MKKENTTVTVEKNETENKIDVSQLSETPNLVLGQNGVKGHRVCKQCGVLESETLKKNEKYSFCKGICVFCYNKNRTLAKGTSLSKEQLQEKINKLQNELQHYTNLLSRFDNPQN